MGWMKMSMKEKDHLPAGEAPPDYGNLASLTYFALGVGYLLPWNSYLTAVDYFDYLYPNSHIDRVFTMAYLIPALITLSFVIAFSRESSSRIRCNVGLVLLLISILVVPSVDALFISGDGSGDNTFAHYVTVGAVLLAGIGESLVQATVIGSAGELPDKFMQASVAGTAACGVLVSFLRIVTKAALPQDASGLRKSANVYFGVTAVFLVVLIAGYNQVDKLPIMIFYHAKRNALVTAGVDAEPLVVSPDVEVDDASLLVKVTDSGKKVGILGLLMRVKWILGSVVLIYVVTLSIFPGFLSEDVHSTFFANWYPILLIATYNVFDLVGKSATAIYMPSQGSVTVGGSIARLLFYPLFAACLHGPKAFRTEGPVFILTALLGVTNGYFTSTAFVVAPKLVPFAEAERAGIIIVIALAVGLTLGSLVSWDYMEDYEVMIPFQALSTIGYTVDAICPGKKKGETCPTAIHDFEGAQTYSEKPGHNFVLSASFDDIRVDEYDALVIPGGRAPEYLALNDKVLSLVQHFAETKKPIASICHGQQILAAAGVLKGKKCTAYPAVKPQVLLGGGEWLEPEPITKCFTDGQLVTGAAWPAHPEFVAQLLELLGTKISF